MGFAWFTEEQQKVYDGLSVMQQKYISNRARGYTKTNAYILAGYKTKNATQAAYLLERRNPIFEELINAWASKYGAKEKKEKELDDKLKAKTEQDDVSKAMEVVDNGDTETAARIKFYRDIIAGKIKNTKKITRKNDMGKVIDVRIEESVDIDAKMKARKELDRLLGLNQMIDLGQLSMGDITINIVDASKKDAIEDSRNKVELEPMEEEVVETTAEEVEEQDGE